MEVTHIAKLIIFSITIDNKIQMFTEMKKNTFIVHLYSSSKC